MSRAVKITLAVIAGLLIACGGTACIVFFLVGRTVQRAVITRPEEVKAVARGIASYALPANYQERLALKLPNATCVTITGSEHSDQLIMLLQFNSGQDVDQATMELALEQAMQQQQSRRPDQDMQVVGHSTVTIRGEEVTLTISESASSTDQRARMVSGTFQGKGGPAFLMIAGSVDTWNQAEIDEFIASIR